jgi:hypothetical protein
MLLYNRSYKGGIFEKILIKSLRYIMSLEYSEDIE